MTPLEPRRLAVLNAPTPAASPVVHEREGLTTLYDFCLMPYALPPPAPGVAARVAAETVLLASFAHEGLLTEGRALVEALRRTLGAHCTVFGIKRRAGGETFYWEVYFYKRDHTPTDLSLAKVRPCLPCAIEGTFPGDVDWQFFSVELGRAQLLGQAPATITVYQEGQDLAWKIRPDGLELANMYTSFDGRRELAPFLAALRASVHLPRHPRALATVLPPELYSCWRIWLAHKKLADTIYWQRVSSRQVAWALGWARWPEGFRRLFAEHLDAMVHLRWDLGADFCRIAPLSEDDPGVHVTGMGLHASL